MAYALGKLGDPRASDALVQVLKDDEGNVRSSVAWALANLQDVRAVEPLIQILKDEDDINRKITVNALMKVGDIRAIELLTKVLSEISGDYSLTRYKRKMMMRDVESILKHLKAKPMYGPAVPVTREEKEGIFGLLAGIFMIFGALVLISYGVFCAFMNAVVDSHFILGVICGIVPAILGVIELVGAIFAFKRTNWAFALVAAILGLNILGIIFVAVGKKEFH